MNNVKQEVKWYPNYINAESIKESMERMIKEGWRVHTCLNKSSDILVVYEKKTNRIIFLRGNKYE